MRAIDLIVIHCSATDPSRDIGVDEIREMHVAGKGWQDIGYHFVIRRNGIIEIGRDIDIPGAHARGHNQRSVGICLVGGVDEECYPDCNYTHMQFDSLYSFVRKDYPLINVVGHRDLSPDINGDGTIQASEFVKECPCFDVGEFFKD